jgi:hypothetical protein
MKHLVTGGCSFTQTLNCVDHLKEFIPFDANSYDNYKSWAYHLTDLDSDIKLYNQAAHGVGNSYISRSVIYKVQELLDDNIRPQVIIQVSNPNRDELLLNYNDLNENDKLSSLHYLDRLKNDNKVWVKYSWHDDSIQKYFLTNYLNEIYGLVNTFEQVLKLQWYLELNKLDYTFFFGWDLPNINLKHTKPVGQFNFGDFLKEYIVEVYHLWEMIDWSKWWLYSYDNEKGKSNYGGLTEWSWDNMVFEDRFITGDLRNRVNNLPLDQHPSDKAHKMFAKKVVSKWIK